MKLKALITEIEKKIDKNQKDYWVIRTMLGETRKTYLAFAGDNALSSRAAYLLMNVDLVDKTVLLTIKKQNKDNLEKVIDLELER
jgi:hypothetical protein